MGITTTKPSEPEEVISARQFRSELFSEQRNRRHKLYTTMIKKALSSENKSPIESFPNEVFFMILSYLTPEISVLLSVSSKWHVKILETLDYAFSAIESQFAMIHSNLVSFKRSYSDFTKMVVSDRKGIRIDRVLVVEILPYLNNKTIKIRYNYKHSHFNYYQKAEFKFDCMNVSKRTIWAHRDECKFHGEDIKRAFTQQIPLVNCENNIEVAINWYNLSGNINLDSIQ